MTSGHGMAPGMPLIRRWLNAFASSRTAIPNPRLEALIAKQLNLPKQAANEGSTDGKKINGRKRHIFVDVEGNILGVCVLPAHIHDSEGAYELLEHIHERYPTLQLIWADGAYVSIIDFFADVYTITVEITKKLGGAEGFVVIPRRWVVERTLAWLGRYRVLGKEYTHRVEYSETGIYMASIHRMLNKLHPNSDKTPAYQSKLKNISKGDAVII